MFFPQRCKTMSGSRLCLLVFLFLSFANGAGAVECYWCSGVGKDRQCELSPRNVSTGPVSIKCSMRYCISTKVMDGVTGEVQSFARHCDHIPHGNVCVKDSRLITCFETCTSDLCNSGNPDPSYLRTQEYSFTYLGLPGLGSALYRSEDKDLVYNDALDMRSETRQYKDFVTKSSKVPSLESLKIVAYKSKEDRDKESGGSGQRGNKVTRPWKWWEMTRGIRRRKGYAGTVTKDNTQQVTMDKKQQSVVDHEVTRPASRVESKIAVNSVKAVHSSVKATENKDKTTGYDDREKTENSKLNYKGDKRSKGDKLSQRHLESDSRHTFDYIGYPSLSKKKQSKLVSEKKPMNIYHEFEKISNTVTVSPDAKKHRQAERNRDIPSVQSNLEIQQSVKDPSKGRPSQETFPSESIDSRNKIEHDGFEYGITQSAQGNIQSAQGNIQSAQGNMKSTLGNIQTAQNVEGISHNNGKNLNDQLLYVNGISRNTQVNKKGLLKDEQRHQDLTTLKSLSPEYSDLTDDELELLPLFEALISDEELAKHFKTLFLDDETAKETGSQMKHKFPTVRPTYGLLETANIYSSQRDFPGALGTRSPTQELIDNFREEEHVDHHEGVTKFRKHDKQFEHDFIPQPFRIRSLEIKDEMINAKNKQSFDKTNLSTTATYVHVSSTLSKNPANIDQIKQHSSLPPFFLKLDNGKGSIYNTKDKMLNPYEINEVSGKVTSPGTDTAKPKRAFLEMDRFRSPSDSSSDLSPNHNNLKTRSPHWVSEAYGKRVTIHTGKTKQPQMPLEMNALKFAKPGLRTTVLNTQNAVKTSQTPLLKNMFSSFEKMNGNIENHPADVVTKDETIQTDSSHKSSQQRRELVDRLKDEKIYHINNALTEKSASVFPPGKDKINKRDNYIVDFQGHGNLVNNKYALNKQRVHSDKRSGTDITDTSLTSDNRSDTTTIRETTFTPHPITFDTRLTQLYLNDFLTSINLKLGQPKSDSQFLRSIQLDKEKFVTPRSDTYRTTLFTGQIDRGDNETFTEEERMERSGNISKSMSATTVRTLSDSPSGSLIDTVNGSLSSTVSRSLSDTVSGSPTEEVQIATPNPYFSVTDSENLKTELPDKRIAIDKSVQSKTEDVLLAHTASGNSTLKIDNRFGNKIKANERKHSTDSVHFRTSGVDKDYTFKASVFVTSSTRYTPEVITFPRESSDKVSHVEPVARTIKDKNQKNKKIGLSAKGNPVHPQTLPRETWRTTNVLPSDTFKTSFNSLESNPNELFQSKLSSTKQNSRDIFLSSTEASSVRKGSLTPYTPLQDDTPSVNNEDRYVLEAYKDTLKELSQNSGASHKHALKSLLSGTTLRAPTPTVFVTPRVHRLGRLEKLEGGRRMFSFNRENVSSSVHDENARLCVFTIVLMVLMALI